MQQILILKEPDKKIKDSTDCFYRIKKIRIDYSQENFIVIYLNTKNQIIKSEVLFKGGLNATLIDARTIFRNALLNNACHIIVAHNHPSGNLNPSYEDKEIFNILSEIGDKLQLTVLDSIIFNKKEFYSIKN